MLDVLMQVLVFVLEAVIVVVAVLTIVAGIFAIAGKGKLKDGAKITIRKLNKYYENVSNLIKKEILEKATYKKWRKEKKQAEKEGRKKTGMKKRLFVINFNGDIRASGVGSLREEITAVLNVAAPEQDEVVIRLESSGGLVHSYGLAASQLRRIKALNIPLTVIVDKVAASGGYMMACVADRILAAPFAIIGSIGVIAQLPNFNRLLKKHDVEFEQATGGEYKRTLTLFGENTREGRKKFQQEIDEAHELFKDFVKQNRSQIDIEKLSTGEHWFGTRALELNLIDEIITSDDYLLQASKVSDLYEIRYHKKKKIYERVTSSVQLMIKKILSTFREETEVDLCDRF